MIKLVEFSVIVEVEDDVDLDELQEHLHSGISFIEDEGHNMEEDIPFKTVARNIEEVGK